MNKIAFLDFDGVITIGVVNRDDGLHVVDTLSKIYPHIGARSTDFAYLWNTLQFSSVRALNELYAAGYGYVLTTSWRGIIGGDYAGITALLRLAGFHGRIIDEASSSKLSSLRCHQITDYLRSHRNIEKYVIIDDDRNAFYKMPAECCIPCNPANGLLPAQITNYLNSTTTDKNK